MTTGRLILVGVHLLANALLFWLGYRWLGLDESDGSHLFRSFGLAAVILLGFAWLHGFALAKFSGFPLRKAVFRSLFTLIPLALLSLLAVVLYAAFAWMEAKYSQPAFVIASFLTLHLRTPIPPSAVQSVFHFIVLVFEWGIVPAALLRAASKIIGSGSVSRKRGKLARSFPLFALLAAVLLFCAVWVPLKLFYWIPNVTSFNGQMLSLVLRVGVGYLLFVSGSLLLDFLTSSGSPADTQPSTVA